MLCAAVLRADDPNAIAEQVGGLWRQNALREGTSSNGKSYPDRLGLLSIVMITASISSQG